jgi:hypothetical protein
MKKFAVIGVSLLAALAILAYVFLADRSSDTEDTNEAACTVRENRLEPESKLS